MQREEPDTDLEPSPQPVQLTLPEVDEYRPAAQKVHAAAPAELYQPTAQLLHRVELALE